MIKRALPLTAAIALGLGGAAAADPPTPITHFPLVTSEITLLAADGAVLDRLSCEWTEPGPEDRPCIAFAGDPETWLAAIREAGADRAVQHVTSPENGLDALTRYTRRSDGTWLTRTRGSARGRELDNGSVVAADGSVRSLWDAAGKPSARGAVKAAAARVDRKLRARRG